MKMMTNKETPVENVHGEVTEEQKTMLAKVEGLRDYLNTEPKAILVPNLRITEQGIIPDVRLALVQEDNEEESKGGDVSEADAGEGGGDVESGDSEGGDDKPSEASDTTG